MADLLHADPIDHRRKSQCTVFQCRLHACRYSGLHFRTHLKRISETVWHISSLMCALWGQGALVPRGAAKTVASEMVNGTWSAKLSTFATICNNVTLAELFFRLAPLLYPDM